MKKIVYSFFSFFLFIICLYGCIEDPHPGGGILNAALPSVTLSIEGVTATSVTVKIEVEAENGAPVSQCGVCWTTAEDLLPTIANDTLVAGNSKGSFTVTIPNLLPDQKYYLRPFATNSVGTNYTEEKREIITQDGLGIVSTLQVINITATSAECGGKIELQGEIDIAERGIILEDISTAGIETRWEKIDMETDSFYHTISDLKPSTSYYVKAYVKDILNRLYISNDPDSVKFDTPDGLPVLG
ncbi:MAG: fibronectin type III domain-containing protein, partial [Tannerellaceae bacterium]|nr:fibronectin type III domain-containing protein [Tannerellaceae bacterium]